MPFEDRTSALQRLAAGRHVRLGAALRRWLRELFTCAASKKHAAAELLAHVEQDSPIFDNIKTRVIAAGTPLFDAAQAAHEIRDDLTLDQVLTMLVSIAGIDGDAAYQRPILETVLDGLIPAVPTRGGPA